jgi:hypothetical protein
MPLGGFAQPVTWAAEYPFPSNQVSMWHFQPIRILISITF